MGPVGLSGHGKNKSKEKKAEDGDTKNRLEIKVGFEKQTAYSIFTLDTAAPTPGRNHPSLHSGPRINKTLVP
jgi:hypothetical protein